MVEEGFGFDLEAHPLAALLEVAQGDDVAGFVEEFADDAGASLETLVVFDGAVEVGVLAPNDFEARYGS